MKNFIYTLFIGLIFGVTTQAQVLNVPTIEQEQDLWCWAGISKSALDYYGEVHEQCEIVEWVRTVRSGYGNDPCCANPSGPCNNTNVLYNSAGSIQDILYHFKGISSEMKGFAKSEAAVADAIARNAVIPCAWQWSSSGGGHAVLIHGYVDGMVYYMDPWFGEGKKIATYANFNSGDDGSDAGHHNWTQGLFFTTDVSAVDTIPCETPASLTASASGTTVTLNWPVVASALTYNVEYREQGASAWITENVSGNSANISALSPLTSYEFRVAAVCNSVSESDYSSIVSATTEDGPLVYCDSKGSSVAGEWIQSVSFGSISNTSNANGGYADFTAQSTSITAGTSENITLTPGFPSNWLYGTTTQPEMWSVWIDLNQDGDFNDANELRYSSSITSTSAVSANISIPSGTLAGTTRMRIAMKRSTAAGSCETFANGEVEDYSVTIIADLPPTCDEISNLSSSNASHDAFSVSWNGDVDASSYNVDLREVGGSWNTTSVSGTSHTFTDLDAETTYEVRVATVCSFGNSDYSSVVSATTTAAPTCDTPSGLAISGVTNSGFSATWSASSNAVSYSLEIRENGGSWSAVSTTSTSYNFSGLSPETAYDVRVSALCSFGNSSASALVSTTTLAGPITYCSASGTSASEWIEAISLESINNTSGANGGYADFTSQSTSLELDESASLTITPGFPYSWLWGYTTQAEFYSVWIDLNQDGDFDDVNELQYVSPSSTATYEAFTVNISIPASAALGETRLRVAMKRSSAANSCGAYSNGEVEDYTVNIVQSLAGGSSKLTSPATNPELLSKIYPNPASTFVNITLNPSDNINSIQLTVTDLTGKVIHSQSWKNSTSNQTIKHQINTQGLHKGIYLVNISANNGMKKQQKLVVH